MGWIFLHHKANTPESHNPLHKQENQCDNVKHIAKEVLPQTLSGTILPSSIYFHHHT